MSRGPVSQTYRISQTFEAPIEFVFDWCTAFRDDPGKTAGPEAGPLPMTRTKDKIVWVVKQREVVRAAWLPPQSSRDAVAGGAATRVGEYTLTSLGRNRSRLDVKFTVTRPSPVEGSDEKEREEGGKRHWEAYAKSLEEDWLAYSSRME